MKSAFCRQGIACMPGRDRLTIGMDFGHPDAVLHIFTLFPALLFHPDTGLRHGLDSPVEGIDKQPVITEQDNAGGRFLGGGQTVVHQGFGLFHREVPAAHLIQHPAEVLLPFQPEQSPGMTL